MIIESVKKYFESCPQVLGKRILVNCLGPRHGAISIENIPREPVVKKYCDGRTLKQFCFFIAMRAGFDEDESGSMEMPVLFEKIDAWIVEQNAVGILPELESGYKSIGIETVKSGEVSDSSMDSMRYQMEVRLLYI